MTSQTYRSTSFQDISKKKIIVICIWKLFSLQILDGEGIRWMLRAAASADEGVWGVCLVAVSKEECGGCRPLLCTLALSVVMLTVIVVVMDWRICEWGLVGFSCRAEEEEDGSGWATLAQFVSGCLASVTILKTTCTPTQGSDPSPAPSVGWASHRSPTCADTPGPPTRRSSCFWRDSRRARVYEEQQCPFSVIFTCSHYFLSQPASLFLLPL